jgi:RHS repeat-associated protein
MTTSRQYDVYGTPRAGTQQGVTASSSQGYVGSLGHVTDQSTGGLNYMQARYYDPGIGRFVSEDPGQNGKNWFIYCADDPVNNVDQNGKSVAGILKLIVDMLIILSLVLVLIAIPEITGLVFDFVMADVAVGATADILTAAVAEGLLFVASNAWMFVAGAAILSGIGALISENEGALEAALGEVDSDSPAEAPSGPLPDQPVYTNV